LSLSKIKRARYKLKDWRRDKYKLACLIKSYVVCMIRKTIKENNSKYTLYDNTNKTFYDTYSNKLAIIVFVAVRWNLMFGNRIKKNFTPINPPQREDCCYYFVETIKLLLFTFSKDVWARFSPPHFLTSPSFFLVSKLL